MILFRMLQIVLPFVLVLGGMGFAAYGLVAFLERRRELAAAGGDPALLATMQKARAITGRIRTLLPESAGGTGEALGGALDEIVGVRLPAALERQRRLLAHLAGRDRAGLLAELAGLQKKVAAIGDRELKGLTERNIELLRARIDSLDRLEAASHKADAYIRSLLLNLEAFEDRLAASALGKVDTADRRIGAMIEDVKLLEAAYDDLEALDGEG